MVNICLLGHMPIKWNRPKIQLVILTELKNTMVSLIFVGINFGGFSEDSIIPGLWLYQYNIYVIWYCTSKNIQFKFVDQFISIWCDH